MQKTAYLLLTSFLLFQCEPPQADLIEYQKEKENREPKKINQGELMLIASNKAKAIIPQLNYKLPFDSLAKEKNIKIKKIILPDSSDIEKENLIIKAYSYNVKNQLRSPENEQLVGTTYLLNKPIIENDSLLGIWSIRINLYDLVKE